ncbi:MAG TPA: hypothetical protein VFU63_03255, partial [Ktedonobacterales bacterium]|nr:hypothetical protein [Ktedonobacterales bacterium]
GVILVVSYGWVALQERSIAALFRRLREATAKPAHVAAPATPAQDHATGVTSEASSIEVTAAIEDVLKEYEAHRISLHEASERIRTLMYAGAGTPTAHT